MEPITLLHVPLNTLTIIYVTKQFHSLSVQAVCDYKRVFMDVKYKCPGSVKCCDAKVFANSSICKRLLCFDPPTIIQILSPLKLKTPNYLIGDLAFQL